mmetsp:Transcript_5076/g.12393  ORF Transcript_5076/g.12393 Transcript_5076/m.12393 type:complete len:224 (-) Transcript_5076:2991-3662(-)
MSPPAVTLSVIVATLPAVCGALAISTCENCTGTTRCPRTTDVSITTRSACSTVRLDVPEGPSTPWFFTPWIVKETSSPASMRRPEPARRTRTVWCETNKSSRPSSTGPGRAPDGASASRSEATVTPLTPSTRVIAGNTTSMSASIGIGFDAKNATDTSVTRPASRLAGLMVGGRHAGGQAPVKFPGLIVMPGIVRSSSMAVPSARSVRTWNVPVSPDRCGFRT